jgi:ABC-2 type transport system ATP-binding protein
MDAIVQVIGLHKAYGKTVAVEDVSFDVNVGEIFGMVGPNGAGKTTTIECLEGLRKPDRGALRVFGLDPLLNIHDLRLRSGMQLQQSNLPSHIKVWEALDLYASFYPKPVDWRVLLQELGLEEKRNTAFTKLSGGQKQRLFIALALLPDPELVFLDELTTGLDPQARHAIWGLVREVRARGKTVFLTTHFMEEAEKLCDRIAILDHGRIVAMDSPANLIHRLPSKERVIFSLDGGLTPAVENVLSREFKLETDGAKVIVYSKNGEHGSLVGELVSLLTEEGIHFHDLRTEQPNLEDVFLSLTGTAMRE